jgi:hypothetical protein
MQPDNELPLNDIDGIPNPQSYLEIICDEDVLDLMKQLPMIAGNDGAQFTMPDLIYEIKLWPFVKQAWSEIDGGPGIAGRVLQMAKVFKKAEADLEDLTGDTRRLPRVIDLPSFIEIYSTKGLP